MAIRQIYRNRSVLSGIFVLVVMILLTPTIFAAQEFEFNRCGTCSEPNILLVDNLLEGNNEISITNTAMDCENYYYAVKTNGYLCSVNFDDDNSDDVNLYEYYSNRCGNNHLEHVDDEKLGLFKFKSKMKDVEGQDYKTISFSLKDCSKKLAAVDDEFSYSCDNSVLDLDVLKNDHYNYQGSSSTDNNDEKKLIITRVFADNVPISNVNVIQQEHLEYVLNSLDDEKSFNYEIKSKSKNRNLYAWANVNVKPPAAGCQLTSTCQNPIDVQDSISPLNGENYLNLNFEVGKECKINPIITKVDDTPYPTIITNQFEIKKLDNCIESDFSAETYYTSPLSISVSPKLSSDGQSVYTEDYKLSLYYDCKSESTVQCTETDGGNDPENAGFTTLIDANGEEITRYDACSEDGYSLVEYYCDANNGLASKQANCPIGCEEVTIQDGHKLGKCKGIGVTQDKPCIDTDEENDKTKPGKIFYLENGEIKVAYDECNEDNEKKIMEATCGPNDDGEGIYHYDKENCGDGSVCMVQYDLSGHKLGARCVQSNLFGDSDEDSGLDSYTGDGQSSITNQNIDLPFFNAFKVALEKSLISPYCFYYLKQSGTFSSDILNSYVYIFGNTIVPRDYKNYLTTSFDSDADSVYTPLPYDNTDKAMCPTDCTPESCSVQYIASHKSSEYCVYEGVCYQENATINIGGVNVKCTLD